jgi:hypothetical protein
MVSRAGRIHLGIAPRELGFAQIELQLIATARNGRGGTGRDEIGIGGAAAAQREQGIRADRLDQKNPADPADRAISSRP